MEELIVKKLLSLILVLVMVMSLAACGGAEAPKTDAPAANVVFFKQDIVTTSGRDNEVDFSWDVEDLISFYN